MRIIISHVYSSDNKGDAALLSVLISDIRRAFYDPQITILTIDKIKEDETFDGVPVKHAFMYYARDRYRNPLLRSSYAAFVAGSTLLWAYVYRHTGKNIPLPEHLRKIVALYKEADLVIPVGGGYILSKRGFLNTVRLFYTVHPLLFTAILGKPTVNYTQSIGPFASKFQERMAKFAVKKLEGVIVREKTTLQLLNRWGVKNVHHSADAGFLFTSDVTKDLRKELGIPERQMLVGITVRDWLQDEAQTNYEKTIAAFADHIIETYNAAVVFIPQVTAEYHRDDDRDSSHRAYDAIEHKENAYVVDEPYDHKTIKALYGKLDYIVGTRFHSVILALTSYVPAIAIGYEHKTRGIMADLDLEHWVIDIEDIEITRLVALFDELISHREVYIGQLKKVLPPYIERAKQSIFFVKKTYEETLE